MLSHCMCRNFHDQEDNEDYPWSSSTSSPNRSPSPSSTPKKSASSSPKRSKISNFCNRHKNKSKNDKNPYSSRGLDKFTLLLADLEDKRIKILDEIAATTTEDIPLIRFGYSNSKGNLVPIIIRLKNQQKKKQETKLHIDGNDKIVEITEAVINRKPKAGLSVPKRQIQRTNTAKLGASPLSSPEAVKKIQKKSLLDKSKSHICKYYFGIVIVLILLCLAIYGRSFAIICMSVCWYLMPVVDNKLNSRSMMKKNNYTDEEKKMGIVREVLLWI